ncbi:MAG: hypothetical protein HZC25_11340 [Rhodospirillales bacterium]|nr:hypothetical protein [Rhodospirillales bacterium]
MIRTLLAALLFALVMAGAQASVEPPDPNLPAGRAFDALRATQKKLAAWALALAAAVGQHEQSCLSVRKDAPASVHRQCRADQKKLDDELDRYDAAKAQYEADLRERKARCLPGSVQSIETPMPGAVDASGCSATEIERPPVSTKEKGVVFKEPPPPGLAWGAKARPIDPGKLPKAQMAYLGDRTVNLVFDGLNKSLGDIGLGERLLYRRLIRLAPEDGDLYDAASYLTGMRLGAEEIGASPRPPTDADAKRYRLPVKVLDGLQRDPSGAFATTEQRGELKKALDDRNRLLIAALKAENYHVENALRRLEKQAYEQPVSGARQAARILQGIQVYRQTPP